MPEDDADYAIDNPGVPGPASAGEAAARPPIPGTGPPSPDDDDEFDLPPLPELPRSSGRPEIPDGGQGRAPADEEDAGQHPLDAVDGGAPDLEAIYAAATGMGAVQAEALEAITANHWAWYVMWQERGFSEKRAFALLRVMVREQCRSLPGHTQGHP